MAAVARTTRHTCVTPQELSTQGTLRKTLKTKIGLKSVNRVHPRLRRSSGRKTRQKCPKRRFKRNKTWSC